MKKSIMILICFAMCISICSCDYSRKNDMISSNDQQSGDPSDDSPTEYLKSTWDGGVAADFQKGNGTKDSPYEITNAQQFALLAKNVNEGITYSGKYFSLLCDINLNNIDWTPIGNGIHSFMGNFEGNGHTVENLKITQSIHFTYEYPTGKKAAYCDSGLFATVQDATIQNIVIDGATIIISDTKSTDTHRVGVLCGTVRTYQDTSVISNIKIQNTTITADFSKKTSPQSLSVGGAIGHVYAYNNTTTSISLIEVDTSISFANSFSTRNYVGTVLGGVNMMSSVFVLENCVAYQTFTPNLYQYYFNATYDFCGAIGNAQASVKPFTVKNVFSKLTINKPALEGNKYLYSEITAYTLIGEAYYFALKDDPNAVGYKFENVFGCVEHVDTTGEKQSITQLFDLPTGSEFSQINCQGCEALPENHGFDSLVWDLSDLSKPKLKKE